MSPGGSLLLVDQGSTATKAAIVGPHGERRLERTVPVERRQNAGRITHDAEDLAKRLVDLIAELAEEAGPRASDGGVGALGLTCQRSTCLLWDRASGAALTPALSWQDTSESDRIERLGGQSTRRIAELTGLRASPHYAASKLAALLEEVPRGRERAETGEITAGTLDAFLIRRLTGRASTEPGHAGRTLLYELATGEWSDELCDLFGIPRAALPELLPSAAPRGEHRGLPIVAAAGDQQAALLGHGGWNAGALVAHFGTGAFVLASTAERIARHEGLLTAVVASTPRERRFQIEGSVNAAGSAVDWACRLTGRRIEDHPDRELDPRRLPLLLPGFAGLAAPYWRPAARGAIQGLTFETDPETLIDAALYGVAMRVLDCIEALEQAGAISPETPLRVSGKLTRSSALVGLLANAGQRSVEVSEDEESGLEGLRRLAEAALEGNERALGESPPPGRAVALSWSPDRATSARARWAEFVEAMSRPPAR
jgi:glycerol kinase